MKIFIPFKIKGIGGPSVFTDILSGELKKNGTKVIFDFERNYDVLFVIADCPLKYVIDAKLRNKTIFQRINGVYNPAANGKLYFLRNIKMSIIYNWFADFVIYQSNFSKLSGEKFLGKKNHKHTIIYNGVVIPDPCNQKITKIKGNTRLITFSKFRREDQIKPIIESVKDLPERFSLDIYGSYSENLFPIFSEIKNHANIKWKGELPHDELLKVLPCYDIFLFSDQSACPNSVLEAMASGLAIAAFDRGSINELVKSGHSGEITSLTRNNYFFDPYPFSPEDYTTFNNSIL